MINFLKTTVVFASLTLGGAFAQAQAQATDPNATAPQQGQSQSQYQGQHEHWKHTPQHETAMLTRKLALTPDQSSQVLQILTTRDQQMQALHQTAASSSGTAQPDFKAMHQQMRTIQQTAKQSLDQVFSPAQQQQYAQMMQARHHHGQWQNGGQQNGQPASAPAPAPAPGL